MIVTRNAWRGRWTGTPKSVVQATELAVESASALGLSPDASFRAEVETFVQTMHFDEVEEFIASIGSIDRIEEIDIKVGEADVGRPGISLRFGGRSGYGMEVSGSDEEHVRRVTAHLKDSLEQGQQFPRRYDPDGTWLVTFIAAFVVFIAMLLIFGSPAADGDGRAVPASAWIAGGGIALAGILTRMLAPKFELLPSGQQTRLRRFRGLVFSIVLAIAAGIVAGLILG